MGNTTSSKFCPKNKSLKLISSYNNSDNNQDIQICDKNNLCGCLGYRFNAFVKSPLPPSLINDSLNLLGVIDNRPSKNQTLFSSQDWDACKEFIITNMIKNYEGNEGYENEKTYIAEHIDTYGWVERSYQSSGLLRGEIICLNEFIIKLFIDRYDLLQSCSFKLRKFDINDDTNTITQELSKSISELPFTVPTSLLTNIFTSQDLISNIITNGYVSGVTSDPPTYYKVSVKFI